MEQKLRIDEERLKTMNKGHNFFNLEQKEKMYFISVMLETTQNLKKKEEELAIRTNLDCLDLPHSFWYGFSGVSVSDFLKELGDFVKKPLAKVRTYNRKNKIDMWALQEIKNNFRNKTLKLSDITIIIGELAENKLKEMEIDFEENVEKLLDLQQATEDKEIQKQVDRFVQLKEKMLSLKTFIGKDTTSRDYWGSSYDKPTDKTLKLAITPLEYNQSLKMIELEIRDIVKELNLKEIGDFDYKTIIKKLSYDKWLKLNKDELENNWEECKKEQEYREGEEDEDMPKTFEEYAKFMYEQNGGVVEVEWEGIPK